jgi:hypothetical protein
VIAPAWLHALLVALPLLAARLSARPKDVASLGKAAAVHNVPPALLVSVCLHESTLSGRGAWCGALGVPGGASQPYAAGHALARWRRRCGSWRGAVALYRHGRGCRDTDGADGYPSRVLGFAARLGAR